MMNAKEAGLFISRQGPLTRDEQQSLSERQMATYVTLMLGQLDAIGKKGFLAQKTKLRESYLNFLEDSDFAML